MDCLPTEIVLKILSYLNTYDLIQFCNAYDNYSCFFKEKSIVRSIDFLRRFELQNFPLCKFITRTLNFVHIKILNISYLYWIPNKDLRKLIMKLDNLEVLYAIDTKLGITNQDLEIYIKLRKLAISIEPNQLLAYSNKGNTNLNVLRSLCLKINQNAAHLAVLQFLSSLVDLEELWICDNDTKSILGDGYGEIAVLLRNLKRCVIKSKTFIALRDFDRTGLIKTFDYNRSNIGLIFEKVLKKPVLPQMSIFDPIEDSIERSWQILGRLTVFERQLYSDELKKRPSGPVESKAIYLNNDSIKDVYFQDLNFCDVMLSCDLKYINAALQILSSEHSAKLKRLSFRTCLFQKPEENVKVEQIQQIGFKRLRRGVQTSCSSHLFESTMRNVKNLRELEILICPKCTKDEVISAYPSIGILENLQKLTLDIPLLLDGTSLKEVFIQCTQLESLYINCVGQNERFVINLCKNIQYTTNLRDFRLYHKEITIDRLLNSFNEVGHKKILRLFFKCDNVRYASTSNETEPFATFMRNNPQLVFFLAVITRNTAKQNGDIQRTINNFKQGNPSKIFHVKKNTSSSSILPIPTAHHDIISDYTNVSVIHFDEF